jgi:hypothetical protein
VARLFRIRTYFVIGLLAMGILAGYFRSWQILVVMALLGVGAIIWFRGRSSSGRVPPG